MLAGRLQAIERGGSGLGRMITELGYRQSAQKASRVRVPCMACCQLHAVEVDSGPNQVAGQGSHNRTGGLTCNKHDQRHHTYISGANLHCRNISWGLFKLPPPCAPLRRHAVATTTRLEGVSSITPRLTGTSHQSYTLVYKYRAHHPVDARCNLWHESVGQTPWL